MDSDEWTVKALGDAVAVARVSPWCEMGHWEGLSKTTLAGTVPVEQCVAFLKQKIILYSAGWGACRTCHPDAVYDDGRVQEALREMQGDWA